MSRFDLVISPRARKDLQEIHAFTHATWGEALANACLDKMETGFDDLA